MNEIFLTNTYRVLKAMYNNSHQIGKEVYCPLGQGEIAEELGLSRVLVNKIFSDLRKNNYITMMSRGKWQLTKQANCIVETIESVKH